jgi:beta-galactosidase
MKKIKEIMNGVMKIGTRLMLLLYVFTSAVKAQKIQLGTEIWIEPGYSKEAITQWAKITADAGFKDVRIFMMWTHVEPALDKWDFEVYDWMFEACEKNNLKLQVTINANQPAFHYGKEFWSSIHTHGIFSDEKIKEPAAKYIKKVVERYKKSTALENWWLMNEPYPMDGENSFILSGFRTEMKNKYKNIEALNKRWNSSFTSFEEIKNVKALINAEWAAAMPFYDWSHFTNKHLTDFQRWVRDEVVKYDTKHLFHTNPGAYLSLYYRQEASNWQPFLNSLGLSSHPTWHFDIFNPEQYAMAVAATCEAGRSVSSPNPFWVSELSAGNNMYYNCPSANEIAQWTWVGIAQGAQKLIYWLLNARTSGNESGEWALLNFQNEPTDRLKTATKIAGCLKTAAAFFDKAKPVESNISILLSSESSLTYERKGKGSIHIQAAMGCYEALAEKGIAVKIEQRQDFKWANSKGKAIIMANMFTIPNYLVDSIKIFLTHGNKMMVLGPTGLYNEYEDCQFLNFPFKKEFGAEPQEIKSINERFQITTTDGKHKFETNKILGTIKNNTANIISTEKEEVTGVRNKTGNSEVVWIPSAIDMGAWKFGNNAVSQFLSDELALYSATQAFAFANKTNKVGMQTMYNGQTYCTVITNGLDAANTVQLINKLNKKATIIFCTDANRKDINTAQLIQLLPKECIVLLWK